MSKVPGKTPRDALVEYVQPIRRSLNCVTTSPLVFLRPAEHLEQDLLFQEPGGTRVLLANGTRYRVTVNHKFVIDSHGSRNYKVRTLGYRYALDIETDDGAIKEVMEYHWHPRSLLKFPHIHVTGADPNFHKMHLPTCRVSLEDFLLCLIDDFQIPALNTGYKAVLANNRRKFYENCKWVWDWARQKC